MAQFDPEGQVPIWLQFSDGRHLRIEKGIFGDPDSIRVSVIGPRGGVKQSFILYRSNLETILELVNG